MHVSHTPAVKLHEKKCLNELHLRKCISAPGVSVVSKHASLQECHCLSSHIYLYSRFYDNYRINVLKVKMKVGLIHGNIIHIIHAVQFI